MVEVGTEEKMGLGKPHFWLEKVGQIVLLLKYEYFR